MTNQTAEEVLHSLTGFDEMAITQHFGKPVSNLDTDESMLARALVFVLKRRDGMNDDDARNEVLGMRLKDVMDAFAEEDDDAGKESLPSETQPAPSLSSVI